MHPELAKVQWINFNKNERDFYANFSELIRTLDSDREYIREHSKWSGRSRDWQQAKKSKDLLLRGIEVARAYNWLETAQQENKQPPATNLLQEYINTSQAEEERQQQEEEKRLQRELKQERKALKQARQRNTLAAIATVLLTATSIYALSQQQLARHQTKIAWSGGLAHQSALLKDKQGSLLLALESSHKLVELKGHPKLEADRALRDSLAQLPNFAAWMNHEGPVLAAIVSPDGKYVATASYDNTARVWETLTGEEIARLNHDNGVLAVAFSPDGKYIATASDDNTARVWEAAKGREIARLNHENSVRAVVFSPDGRYLATASNDDTARVWETATGKEVVRNYMKNAVTAVAFSADGRYVASASEDNTARVDMLSHEDLMVAACDPSYRNLTASEWEEYMERPLRQYGKTCENLSVHPSAIAAARDLARSGKLRNAAAVLRHLQKLEPDIDINPQTSSTERSPLTVARHFRVLHLVKMGEKLARQGKVEEAIDLFLSS